jgi:hypothetical protein
VRVAVFAYAFVAAVLFGAPAMGQPLVVTPAAPAQSDEAWLAQRLLSDVLRDSNVSDIACISRVMLRKPGGALAMLESKNPGLMDYALNEIVKQMRQEFYPQWEAARADLAARLAQFPSSQRTAMRAFFESPTGIKYIGYIYTQFPGAPARYDPGRGFDQCYTKLENSDLFEAVMTDEDMNRLAEFPDHQESQLTPTFIVRLAGQLGVRTTQTFVGGYVPKFGPLIEKACAEFQVGRKLNGDR